MRATLACAVVLSLFFVAARGAEAQASFETARNLYASAEYDGALAMLDGLLLADHSREERRSIELHRILCLVATGREAEAADGLASLVGRNPLFRPSDDVPPRVRSTFVAVRKRVLPGVVRSSYQRAKAAFEAKDYEAAHTGFSEVLEVLTDPDIADVAAQSPLSDLRMLATGFEELSEKALALAEAAAAAPPPVAPEPGPAPIVKTYSAADQNVVPPIAVNQRIPAFPGPVRSVHAGVVEVIIDDMGAVESAMMIEPINPQYDRLTLTAARSWQYVPARVDGMPVRFVKRIRVSLVPNP